MKKLRGQLRLAGAIVRTGAQRLAVALFAGVALAAVAGAGLAQDKPPALPKPGKVPNFWDLQKRVEKPDVSFLRLIRFVTDDEYPPFGFTAPDGSLTGFNVELARAICQELKVRCTIQARRFDLLIDALNKGEADAAIASIAINTRSRELVDFTSPYYRTPARFAARKGAAPKRMRPDTLKDRTVGVRERTAHAAYLQRYFPETKLKTYDSRDKLFAALKSKEIDIVFGDGVTLAIWLNGTDADGCCEFRDGPFTSSRYFGEGVGIAVRKGNRALRRVLDFALVRLYERGVYSDLYLKYFPIGFY